MRTLRHLLPSLLSALLGWSLLLSQALAQDLSTPTPEKSYTAVYGLVLLCIVLGLMLVLRPVGRSDEVKTTKRS